MTAWPPKINWYIELLLLNTIPLSFALWITIGLVGMLMSIVGVSAKDMPDIEMSSDKNIFFILVPMVSVQRSV